MIKRILIPLDTLLDTRLAVIRNLNPEAAERLVATKDYWYREIDDWTTLTGGLVTTEQVKEAYAKRGGENTADTLNAAIMTGISPLVLKILAEDNVNRIDNMGDPTDYIALAINIHPYNLDWDYKHELEMIVKEMYGDSVEVEINNYSLEELNPERLDSLYSAFITYDFHEWMQMHYMALSKVRMPCFNFIGPRLFEKDVSKLTLDQKKFELFKFRVERLIHMDFEFIDSMYFSMFRPSDGKLKDDISALP